MKRTKLYQTTAILLATLVAQPFHAFAQQNNNNNGNANQGNNGNAGGDNDSDNESENSNDAGSGNNAGGNGNGNNNNNQNNNAGGNNGNAGGTPNTPPVPDAPAGQTSVTTESNPLGQLIQAGVDDLNALEDIGYEGAQTIIEAAGGDLEQLGQIIEDGGGLGNLIETAGGASNLVDAFEDAEGSLPSTADELLGEAADLINQIFQDATITTGILDTGRLFDRARLFSNNFNVEMIGLAAEYSGNDVIGAAITDAVNLGNLSESNSWIGELTEVLSNSSNANILGARSKEIGGLLDITTDDFVAYAGKDVTIEAGSQVDLSSHGTKVFAIVGGDDLHIAGDVTFSDRSSSWDKEALAIGAADDLTVASGSTIEYQGNYLGLGASSNVSLVNVTVKSGSGVGVGSLADVTISNSTMELTNSRGGFGFYADNLLDIDGLAFAGPVDYIYMEATTINLKDIDFPAGSSIDMVSELGPIDGKYPNFGNSLPGRVNFISGVSYGGAANVMNDQPSFDQHGKNIEILGF